MGRPVVLSNGSLFVGLNEQGMVHDFYYPYVGLDNLTTSRSAHHKIGVWVENAFSWVDDGSWETAVNFEHDALVSVISMKNPHLGVELFFQDFVDHEFNSFCRTITVSNKSSEPREVRLFMHQVFQISRAGRGDTALFEPEESYIFDYKGRCSLLIYGQSGPGMPCDQFAIGSYGIEGKEGTFRDAEDGELSGNAIEHGGVDSVMRFNCVLGANQSSEVDYWIIAADTQYNAEKIHNKFLQQTLTERLAQTRRYWHDWLDTGKPALNNIEDKYREPVQKSLLIIKAHVDRRGGVVASGDSSIYNYGRDYYSYIWPRDGAFAVWPLIRMGYTEEAKHFFEFCRDVVNPDGYMMHKYQPDRSIGSTWHPLLHDNRKELAIQEDETAIILYMLGEYYRYSKDQDFIYTLYDTFIQPCANFLATYVDPGTGLPHASYDLWEQKFLTSTYTVAVVYQSLLVAAHLAELCQHPDDADHWTQAAEGILKNSTKLIDAETQVYYKGLLLKQDGSITIDKTLDVSSMYGSMMFGLYKGNVLPLHTTVKQIESRLLSQSPSDGVPRYEYDAYFASEPPHLGNPWFVTTFWLAQYYVRTKNTAGAEHFVEWAMRHSYPSGVLSEQVNPNDGSPVSVAPLVWSHAELVNTILDLSPQAEGAGNDASTQDPAPSQGSVPNVKVNVINADEGTSPQEASGTN